MDIETKEAQKIISSDCAATGVIDLAFHSLNRVPAYIWGLTSLVDISLDNNDIASLDIPKGSLPNLKRFSVRHNELTTIPLFFANVGPGFELLDVRNNCIEELPESFMVLLNKPEPVIHLGVRWANSSCSDPASLRCLDPHWGGWHGKLPKDGDVVAVQRWGALRYRYRCITTHKVFVDYKQTPGFRLRYEDNPAEEALRASLGMSEGEAWNAAKVRSYLQRKMEAAEEHEEEPAPDYAEIRKEKKDQKLEREKDKKQKQKAIKRASSQRAKQKLLNE